MSELPMMPLWVNDFGDDTEHLSTTQVGGYMLLLMCMWRRGGWVPNEDRFLARICRCDDAEWQQLKPVLMPFLTFSEDGTRLSQKRLLFEIEKVGRFRERQRELGKKSAEARARVQPASPARAQAEPGLQPAPAGSTNARAEPNARAQAETRGTPATNPHALNQSSSSSYTPQTPHEDVGYRAPPEPARSARQERSRSRAREPDSAPRRRTNDWDQDPAPGPSGKTQFLEAHARHQAGDEHALEPRHELPIRNGRAEAEPAQPDPEPPARKPDDDDDLDAFLKL